MHFNTASYPLKINHAYHDDLLSNLIRSLVAYAFAFKVFILNKRSAFYRTCIIIFAGLLYFSFQQFTEIDLHKSRIQNTLVEIYSYTSLTLWT